MTKWLISVSRNYPLDFSYDVICWILVPVMGANLEVILRSSIPLELQGRVYACRNPLQFFTRPIGLFLGGFMVDSLCEPFMEAHSNSAMLASLFGSGKGSGVAMMMLILGLAGSAWCLLNARFMKKYHFSEE